MGSRLPPANHSDGSGEKAKEEFGRGIHNGSPDTKGVASFDASFEKYIDFVTMAAQNIDYVTITKLLDQSMQVGPNYRFAFTRVTHRISLSKSQ